MQKPPCSPAVAQFVSRPSNAQPLDNSADVERVVTRIIAAQARRLIRQRRFHRQDYEDLVQELRLEWLRYRPLFDSRRSCLSTYATRVVDNRIAALIRRRNTLKRDQGGPVLSLDWLVNDPAEGWGSFGSMLSDDDVRSAAGSGRDERRRDLAVDVSVLVASLPDALHKLARQLQTMTITEVSRQTGAPRSTVYESVKQLRRHFAAAGLDQYLPALRGDSAHNDQGQPPSGGKGYP